MIWFFWLLYVLIGIRTVMFGIHIIKEKESVCAVGAFLLLAVSLGAVLLLSFLS